MSDVLKLKELVEDINRAWGEFKAEADKKGAADGHKLAGINAHLDELQDQIDRFETAMRRPPLGEAAPEPPDLSAYKAAYGTYLRKGEDYGLADLEHKALSVGSDPDGGYTVTPEMSSRVSTTIFESSPIREIATVETIGASSMEILVDDDQPGSGWVAESATRTETTTPQVRKIEIPVHELYAEPRATQRILDDANFDVEAWLSGKIADRFARDEATAFVSGDGVGKPRGFITFPAGTGFGQIEQVNSGHASLVQADGLISLQNALKQGYLTGAVWAMKRTTIGEVRKLKDSNNQYLWQPGLAQDHPPTLLGHPVRAADDMPVVAANALAIAFGNFRAAYTIVDRVGIRVLRDPFTAKPFVKFYTTRRVGGDVVNFEAIKLQKIAL